jgi:hypothetical protein
MSGHFSRAGTRAQLNQELLRRMAEQLCPLWLRQPTGRRSIETITHSRVISILRVVITPIMVSNTSIEEKGRFLQKNEGAGPFLPGARASQTPLGDPQYHHQ